MIPNRIVIGAIDSALNRVQIALMGPTDKDYVEALREEYTALREAREYIVKTRRGDGI